MKMFVGVTDKNWYELLRASDCDEVNFWTPGGQNFKALNENDLFLFKLHAPDNFIVGGGFFVRFTLLPTFLAWSAFGIKNGTRNIDELNARILKYRSRNSITADNPQIGCIILTEPFFFEEEDWIPVPSDFNLNIVRGKTYDTESINGLRLYREVMDRLQRKRSEKSALTSTQRYSESMTKHRLGQGAFRVVVTDAYHRRCAITGEKTLPVLEAAHIKPYAAQGPHDISNGILLKSDFHTLFDGGYITIDPSFTVEVSKRLHDDFGNGRDYYSYHGKKLQIIPEQAIQLPSREFLDWHNTHVYLG